MPTWKKVIVSGSDASLNQLFVSTAVTASTFSGSHIGNLTGTASWATNALTASYITSSNVFGPFGSNSILSASHAVTAAFALSAAASATPNALTFGTGLSGSSPSFNGGTAVTVAISGSSALTTNLIPKWTGTGLANSSITDTGTSISTTVAITASIISASSGFTGSLFGTASFATSASQATTASYVLASNVAGLSLSQIATGSVTASVNVGTGDIFTVTSASLVEFAVRGTGVRIGNVITDAHTITGSLSISGSLFATSSWATNALTASFLPVGTYNITASWANNATTASYVTGSVFTSTNPALSASFATTASYASSTNNISNAIANNVDNYILTAQGTGIVNGESNLTFNGTTLTVSGNANITGDLTVAGTASFTNTDNLTIRDKFILINSGSSTLADSGWVTQYNAAGSGSAFYLEANSTGQYGRFAVAYDAIGTSTGLTPDEYVVTTKLSAANPTNTVSSSWGGTTNSQGNMWVNTTNGDIYIWTGP